MGARRRGFTLIEALVVVGIGVVLAALLLPALNKARKQAQRIQMRSSLVAIELALETYKNDHRDYPRVLGEPVPNFRGYDGAVVLCRTLFSPVRQPRSGGGSSKARATYLRSEDFPTAKLPQGTPVMLDRFGYPILYFPASTASINLKAPTDVEPHPYVCYVSDVNTKYDVRDNTGPRERMEEWDASFFRAGEATSLDVALARMRKLLGDTHGASGPTSPPDGLIQPDETPVNKPFLVWSAGPDGSFGPDEDVSACDDVTNFR